MKQDTWIYIGTHKTNHRKQDMVEVVQNQEKEDWISQSRFRFDLGNMTYGSCPGDIISTIGGGSSGRRSTESSENIANA